VVGELVRGEGDAQGTGRAGEGGARRGNHGEDRAKDHKAKATRQETRKRRRTGRRSAQTPDGEAALAELSAFLARFCKILNPLFGRIRKTRDESRCLYAGRTFLWTFIVGFLMRAGSRNGMDASRNCGKYADAVLKLAEQGFWPEGERKTAPCTLSCCNYLSRGCTAVLEQALVDIVCHMIRLKLFERARFRGLFVIAIDGTKQEKIRGCWWPGNRKNRFVLEAKLVTPWGSAYSVMSEPMRPWRDENEKQDCEYHAFLRLAPKLKAAFPSLGICILGDSLYACAPLMRICEDNNWDYVFTFKEGRTARAYADAQDQMRAFPSRSGTLVRHDRRGKRLECGTVSWATGIEITDGTSQWHVFNVVKVCEDGSNGSPYNGQFATSLPIRDVREADVLGMWGRRRWGVESSFHVEKHGGFGLEHNFCNRARTSRNIYLLMQISYNLWQLFNSGCLMRLGRRCRNMTQKRWVDVIYQALVFVGIKLELDKLPRRYISREYLTL